MLGGSSLNQLETCISSDGKRFEISDEGTQRPRFSFHAFQKLFFLVFISKT